MDKSSFSQKIGTLLIFVFLGVGLLMQLMHDFITTLIWIVAIGTIFYLYKFPPKWLISLTQPGRHPKIANKKRKQKKYPFRVIDGNKENS